MRFDLTPNGIEPVGIDSVMHLEEDRRGSVGVERAFIEAGLCDEGYIAAVALRGFGVKKEHRHRQRAYNENEGLVVNGQSATHVGVFDAIRRAKSASIN